MISIDVFHRLRAEQLRSVREQELLSGRNWILISACVHALAMVYPVFLWIHVWRLQSLSLNQHLHPAINVGFTLVSGVTMLGFWWWADYAPYRAAVGALFTFVVLQGVFGYLDPHQLVVGATIKALILLGLVQAVMVAHRRHRPQ